MLQASPQKLDLQRLTTDFTLQLGDAALVYAPLRAGDK
jgi:hypothetical protein